MTWSPPRSSAWVPPAGTVTESIGTMDMTPLSSRWVCNSARSVRSGALTAVRTQSELPLFSMVMKAAPALGLVDRA